MDKKKIPTTSSFLGFKQNESFYDYSLDRLLTYLI